MELGDGAAACAVTVIVGVGVADDGGAGADVTGEGLGDCDVDVAAAGDERDGRGAGFCDGAGAWVPEEGVSRASASTGAPAWDGCRRGARTPCAPWLRDALTGDGPATGTFPTGAVGCPSMSVVATTATMAIPTAIPDEAVAYAHFRISGHLRGSRSRLRR